MKLNAIADIHSGVYSNTITNGDVYYFQARDFDENRQLVNNLTPTLNFSENLKKTLSSNRRYTNSCKRSFFFICSL